MPTGESFGPRAGPMHDVLRCRLFPQCKIVTVFLLVLSVQFAGVGDDVVEVTS